MVSQEGGDPAQFTKSLHELAGANPSVTSTPVLLRDNKGEYGSAVLFGVKGTDGRNYLMDSKGAHYTDFDDYLKNNKLPGNWTVTRPANLGNATGDPNQLVTSPAHTNGAWDKVAETGQQLTSAGMKVGLLPQAASMPDEMRDAIYGKSLSTIAKYAGPAFGQFAPSAALGLMAAGGVVSGVSSGHDLISRYQHGRSMSVFDPEARSDYIDVAAAAATVVPVGGAAAGVAGRAALTAGRVGLAEGLGTTARGLGLAGTAAGLTAVGGQGIDLAQNWDQLTDTQKVTQSAGVVASAGLSALPLTAGKFAPKIIGQDRVLSKLNEQLPERRAVDADSLGLTSAERKALSETVKGNPNFSYWEGFGKGFIRRIPREPSLVNIDRIQSPKNLIGPVGSTAESAPLPDRRAQAAGPETESAQKPGAPGGDRFVAPNAPIPPSGLLDPQSIRFSQDNIKGEFTDGSKIDALVEGLRSGVVKPQDVPPIRLMWRGDKLYTVDNRRLWAFQQAGVPVRYRMASQREMADGLKRKFTTKNNGESVVVRGVR